MDKDALLIHFLNDPEFKFLRLWTEIIYALKFGRNPNREELGQFALTGEGIGMNWPAMLKRGAHGSY